MNWENRTHLLFFERKKTKVEMPRFVLLLLWKEGTKKEGGRKLLWFVWLGFLA